MSMVNRKLIFAWCLYDWANSSYSTVIGTFVFSVYFAHEIYGDPTGGSVVWGYTIAGAGLVVSLFAPFAGAIADHGGHHKRWMGLATATIVFASALLLVLFLRSILRSSRSCSWSFVLLRITI